MITWRKYQQGDIARVNSAEPDPFEGWSDQVEANGRALTTICIGERPVVVIGLLDTDQRSAWCFAVVDRERCKGHGPIIVQMLRARLEQAMSVFGLTSVHTTTRATDRPARAFLRAVGLRSTGQPDNEGMQAFIIHRRTPHEQSQEDHQEAGPFDGR